MKLLIIFNGLVISNIQANLKKNEKNKINGQTIKKKCIFAG